jgi:16S rRNA (guanine1207-N2)-methyltransferase
MHALTLLYGQPPHGIVPIPADAVQCSPLIPDSTKLEACAEGSLQSACIYAPPNTLERRYTLALALQALTAGAPLTALAPKDKGGSRIAKELSAFGCTVKEVSHSHHRICTTARPATLQGTDAAIADGGLQQHSAHGFWTQPGLFHWDRIDPGSALLLKHLPPLRGKIAEPGCGLGVLGRAILTAPEVQHLALIDIDRRAVEAAEHNLADPRASFVWADFRTAPLPAHYNAVVMNPPFHSAGIEDHTLGQAFVERAASLLKPGGICWMVANRHLPYAPVLAAAFSRVERIDDADGFRVYRAEK